MIMMMSPLRYLFPLDHKNLMFVIMIVIVNMFMLVMSLVDTKPNRPYPHILRIEGLRGKDDASFWYSSSESLFW